MAVRACQALGVFPTRVGVNRSARHVRDARGSFPHPRGGEPRRGSRRSCGAGVFPTRVGVNRHDAVAAHPRITFSPPAWG